MNNFKELKELEELKRYFNDFSNAAHYYDWKYNKISGWEVKMDSLISKLNPVEEYIRSKRKRVYVPEILTNPFFVKWLSVDRTVKDGVVTFTTKYLSKLINTNINGKCKAEFDSLMSIIKKVNMDRTNDNKFIVQASPIKVSARGECIKNSFAIKLTDQNDKITCFYYILGKYHLVTNEGVQPEG